jgi:hypothetical protein
VSTRKLAGFSSVFDGKPKSADYAARIDFIKHHLIAAMMCLIRIYLVIDQCHNRPRRAQLSFSKHAAVVLATNGVPMQQGKAVDSADKGQRRQVASACVS